MRMNSGTFSNHLRAIRPWVAVMAVLAIAIVAYYGSLGMQYWTAKVELDRVVNETQRLSRVDQKGLPEEKGLTDQLELQKQKLTETLIWFNYPQSHELMALLTDLAEGSGAKLSAITSGNPQSEVHDGLSYQVQPIDVTIDGSIHHVQQFLSSVKQELAVASVSAVRVDGEGVNAAARIELLLYLSPKVSEVDKGEN